MTSQRAIVDVIANIIRVGQNDAAGSVAERILPALGENGELAGRVNAAENSRKNEKNAIQPWHPLTKPCCLARSVGVRPS